MADNKKNKVVKTTKTESISKNGDKTIKTVTTTTTTTSTSKKGWKALSKFSKVGIITGASLLLVLAVLLIIFGRAAAISNSMESTIFQGENVFFNRFMTPIQGDVVVFHHPETDSVVPTAVDKNYYMMCRMYGAQWCSKSDVIYQRMHKRPIYLSRVYAEPGQIVEIKENVVFVNKQRVDALESSKYPYVVANNGIINPSALDSVGLKKEDMSGDEDYAETYLSIYRNKIATNSGLTIYSLSATSAQKLQKFNVVQHVEKIVLPSSLYVPTVFPYTEEKHWNQSNFGPLLVPQKGKVLKLSVATLPLYRRCIEAYEGNKVEVNGNQVLINGKVCNSYKFKQNYYFVIGDNRSSKQDSRFFGFLPEDHVVGVAL